jgi:hypothetical protein
MLRRAALPCLISGLLVAGLTAPAEAAPTWLAASTLSAAGQDVQETHVAVNPAGSAIAVWRRLDDAGHWRIQAARHPVGGTWTSPVTLSDAGQDANYADVAVDAAANATVVWERSDGTNPRIQERHSTAGGSWSATVDLSAPTEHAGGAQVVTDGHGNTTVAWTGVDAGYNRIESRRRPAGGTWSQRNWVSGAGANDTSVDLAANTAGAVVAVWGRWENNHRRIQAARLLSGGSWSTPAYLSGANETAVFETAGIDAHGTAVAAWDDVAGSYNVVMATRQPAGGSWTAPQSLSLPSSLVDDPRIAVNPRGDAATVWRRFDGTYNRIQAAVRPTGGSWSTAVTLSTSGLDADAPDVAIDPTGDVIAAWQLQDGAPLAQVRRLPAGGSWGPATNLAPLTTSDEPRVAADGQGNAVAVWRWLDGPDYRTQAAGLDAAGPTAKITAPTRVAQTAKTFTVAWTATDRWSAVASKDVRYRMGSVNGAFGNWVTWKSVTTASSASFTGQPGRTYCFETRARDAHANLGAWSAPRCATVPLDDRAFTPAGGWFRDTGSRFYLRTSTISTNHGATLTRTGISTKRIALLVTRCPGCGKVTVLLAGNSLGTFSLRATKTIDKALIPVKTFATVHAGTLRIKIASHDSTVRIDAVVLARA